MIQKKKSVVKTEIIKPKSKEKRSLHVDKLELTGSQTRFPIVGIGASAGGLEALELFLANIPTDSGMAFVIIQHLDPTRKGIMVQLLQRHTKMQVFQVKDRMRIEANCAYIIPPNKDLSILHGVLYLLVPIAKRGLRLPIDFFFRALADDQQDHSIGVILSGMGSDGTLGLRAIKEKAGAVFVQDPDSAKFDSMPRSAIDAGLADVIAAADALPKKIIAYRKHLPRMVKSELPEQHTTQSAIEKIMLLLRDHTGHDFSLYKKTTIYRRIERRMGLHQIEKITSYVRYLRENQQELDLLFRELLIGVTSFFRDPAAWEQVKTGAISVLLAERPADQVLRAWVPACSTGEEAYSLAILFKEALEELKPAKNLTIQIFATDLDKYAIEKAREGIFLPNITADVSSKRLEKFFVKVEHGYQIAKSIREMVIFAPQNIIKDPPFTKLDILSCRNLLIYLTPELQKKLLPLFHYSLNPSGFLFLGSAETVGNFTDLFTVLNDKTHLYRKLDTSPSTIEPFQFPTLIDTHTKVDMPSKPLKPSPNLQTLADQLILQTYSPAAVVTNNDGDILYISGRTGKYLEPAVGKANWNIFVMAREGLHYGLTSAFQKALSQKETVTLKNMVVDSNGGKQTVNIMIQPIGGSNALSGMVMIVFDDVAITSQTKRTVKGQGNTAQITVLEQELERIRQETQSIREEMQTSQEELRSANEEMQSTNEELQSTNEELTTSKEEMQSMNEELHTVNQELKTKLDELIGTKNDMKNMLDSTDIATLFLDNALKVRRFTSQMSKITKLIPVDLGRPITDIASALLYPELADDARESLRTLVKIERQISTPDGDWFSVRILPYRTLENMIDGVVITFTDITISKKLEAELRNKNSGVNT